jgi:hypothetical protein
MHRQQSVGLLCQPAKRLLVSAVGTMAIAATASGPVFTAAAFTLKPNVAQLARATTGDRGDHLAMS